MVRLPAGATEYGLSPLLRRLDRLAVDQPTRTAVSAVDGELSFLELRERVARLAGAIAEAGAGPGTRVGIHLPRRVDLLPALFAAWWAGAAFVPLDPELPDERLAWLARRSAVDVVISSESGPEWVAVPVIPATAEGPAVPLADTRPGETAYVMFTSGSTGQPKGVEVTYDGVAALLSSLASAGVYPADHRVVACNASISFDASVQQWLRVLRGESVHVLDEESRTDIMRLAGVLRDRMITDIDATPTHWHVLREVLSAEPRPPALRLYLGGEKIPGPLWAELADLVHRGRLEQVINLYGPTECTVDVTAATVAGTVPHIGTALPGRRLYVLDEQMRPVGVGEPGELYIGGGLARGYVDDPVHTAARFVADPGGHAGERVYRSGDRVRRRTDGTLEYLDRTDRQVKVRGHRIELGEVEAAIAAVPGVAQAVVAFPENQVLGYYMCDRGETVAPEDVRSRLAARLPAPMVPTALYAVAEFPRTENGKIDPSGLPRPAGPPDGTRHDGSVLSLVTRAWSEILGSDQVSDEDDFFALGGHSLLALHVVARLRAELDIVVPTREVYRHPVLGDFVRHVAHVLEAGAAGSGPGDR